jgi:hypothetical protein
MLADAVVGDVEGAARENGNIQRTTNQLEQLLARENRFVRRTPVDIGNETGLDLGAHQRVDSIDLGVNFVDDRVSLHLALVPEVHADLRAHLRPCIGVPIGARDTRNNKNRHYY